MRFVLMAVMLFVLALGVQSSTVTLPSHLRVALKMPPRGRKGVSVGVSNLVIVKNVNMGYNNLGLQQDNVDGPVYAAGIATAAQVPASVNVDLSPNGASDRCVCSESDKGNDNVPQEADVVQPAAAANDTIAA